MSHRFRKNNCISDSDSEEENESVPGNSETEESLSSVNDSDLESSKVSTSGRKLGGKSVCEESSASISYPEIEQSDHNSNSSSETEESLSSVNDSDPESSKISTSGRKLGGKSVCEESSASISYPEIEQSDHDSNSSSNIVSNDKTHPKEKELLKDCNSNQFSKMKLRDSNEVVQRDSKCDLGDILVLESSVSVVNDTESVIEDSCNETNDGLLEKPHKLEAAKSKIIEESSDSENSVEFINSYTTISTHDCSNSANLSKEKSSIDSNPEIEIVESFVQSNDSVKNLSKISSRSNNSLSKSGISNGSQSSINSSYDERKALEHQLADKRTAYQNILRAVKTCDPKKLKDGGKLLQEKLSRCKEEVDDLKEKLKLLVPTAGDSPTDKYSAKPNGLFSTSDQVTNNLGKKGLETHRVQAALTVDALVTLHGSLQTCPAEDALETDPKGLRVELMPHQKYALAWLLWREQQIPPGGILADDMGLGKTLTMIALVLRADEYKRQKNIDEDAQTVENGIRMYPGKTLVVCPSSLMGQWQGQIKQHCKPHVISALIHHGKPRELQAKKLAAYDIVISSYGVAVEENKTIKGDKKGPLFRVKWERVILDEGHVIKNHKTKTAQALCELEAKYRWCLTGTPVQNKELDMYSLLKFLRCQPFDSLPVWKRWVDNKSANGIQRLNTVVKSILLRRTKEELQSLGELRELPNKTSVPVYITLDEEEQKVYHTVLHFSKKLLAEFILQEQKKHGFVSDELRSRHHELLHSANEIKATEIFVLLLRLRQICCLPGLIHSLLEKDSCSEDGIDPEDDPILQSLTSQMKRMSVGGHPIAEDIEKKQKILVESNPVFQINRPSGKIRTVLGIIKEALEVNDKIVIVSQWANLLQKLKVHIVTMNTDVVTLDGSVPVKLRPGIIEDFNKKDSKVKVMLLSLTAGGVGLNLMGGNRLVIFEPHWNPQLESQACDRIYRVGQRKQVYIYKIICKGTIEEKIELLQKKKLEIANSVLKGELKMNRSKLTLADLKTLFDIH